MNSKNLLKILDKYEQTDMRVIKENLRNKCNGIYNEYGGRQGIADFMNIELNALQSSINPSHSSRLTFEKLIRFCGLLDLDINDMFEPVVMLNSNKGVSKKWTPEKQNEFISMFDKGNIEIVKNEYSLTDKTVLHYYNLFKKEQNRNN